MLLINCCQNDRKLDIYISRSYEFFHCLDAEYNIKLSRSCGSLRFSLQTCMVQFALANANESSIGSLEKIFIKTPQFSSYNSFHAFKTLRWSNELSVQAQQNPSLWGDHPLRSFFRESTSQIPLDLEPFPAYQYLPRISSLPKERNKLLLSVPMQSVCMHLITIPTFTVSSITTTDNDCLGSKVGGSKRIFGRF